MSELERIERILNLLIPVVGMTSNLVARLAQRGGIQEFDTEIATLRSELAEARALHAEYLAWRAQVD